MMQKGKSKRILNYFFLLILLASINNTNVNNFKDFDEFKNIKINGLSDHENLNLLKKIENLNLENIFFLNGNEINRVIKDMNWDINKQRARITSIWAIINTGGASNSKHHHGNSSLSAAYYVRAPESCGEIVISICLDSPAIVLFLPRNRSDLRL